MKTVHLSPFFDSQLGYEEFYTAKYMSKRGWDVTVVTTDVSNDNSIKYPEYIEIDENGFKIIRLPCLFRYGSDFVIMKNFLTTFLSLQPDLVFIHGSRLPQYTQIAKMRKKNNFVLFVDHHDFFFPGHSMQPMKTNLRNLAAKIEYHYFRRFISKYILKRADKIFPVTRVCREHLTSYFGISDYRIASMEFAVDIELFYFDENKRKEIRSTLNFKEKDFILNFTGIITRRKKFEKIIQLINELRKKKLDKKIKILVVGYFREENYKKEMNTLINTYNISNSIIFTGKVPKEKIKDYYSASDAAFWLENNSVSILEAMACRCIVLVPDMQLSHLVDGNGIVFEPGNITQLSDAISTLARIPIKKIEAKKMRSLELVKKNYDYSVYTNRIFDEYKKVTSTDRNH